MGPETFIYEIHFEQRFPGEEDSTWKTAVIEGESVEDCLLKFREKHKEDDIHVFRIEEQQDIELIK